MYDVKSFLAFPLLTLENVFRESPIPFSFGLVTSFAHDEWKQEINNASTRWPHSLPCCHKVQDHHDFIQVYMTELKKENTTTATSTTNGEEKNPSFQPTITNMVTAQINSTESDHQTLQNPIISTSGTASKSSSLLSK